MKAFSNIVIIALIGLFSSTYLFNLSPIDYRGTIEIETPKETSTLRLELDKTDLLNPESITISHVSEKEEIVKSVSNNIFSLDVYKDNKLIKSDIRNLELVSPSVNMSISVNENNPIVTTLDISQKKLALDDGQYKFVFNSNLIANPEESSIEVNITYDTQGTYYPALNQAPVGTKGLTLYFSTETDTLIPVTRFVVEDKSITRMAIEQLQKGPMNSNMKSVIKAVTNTTYNNGNVVIDLPSSCIEYNSNSRDAQLAYESFVKTIFDVDRYWPIHSITFTVDRKQVDTYFNGLTSESINRLPNTERNYLLYLAYNIDDRYYLFDHEVDVEKAGIDSKDPLEIKAQKLFDAYKNIDINYGINPIPKNINLNNVRAEGSTLILDFNSDFKNSYSNRQDLKQMMIEALTYTFTTLPVVDSIKISVDGEEFTEILYAPEFINPEIVQQTEN